VAVHRTDEQVARTPVSRRFSLSGLLRRAEAGSFPNSQGRLYSWAFHVDSECVPAICGKPTAVNPMPKQKTHKGTKKRFRLTAHGKAKHRQAGTSHLASRKSKKRRRQLRGTKVLAKPMLHQIVEALAGYSS